MTVDAFVRLLRVLGVSEVEKWIDDILTFAYPIASTPSPSPPSSHLDAADSIILDAISSVTNPSPSYSYNINSLAPIFGLANLLGMPLHQEKVQEFGTSVIYVGLLWNIEKREVSLPAKKREKYSTKLANFIAAYVDGGQPVHYKQIASLIGTLQHCAYVATKGRAELVALRAFLRSFGSAKNRHEKTWHLSGMAKTEVRWWLKTISNPDLVRVLTPLPINDDFVFYVDASGLAIGIVWKDKDGRWKYDMWRGKPGVDGLWLNQAEGRIINWAELVGLELVLYAAAELKLKDTKVIVRCDNNTAIGALKKGAARSIPMNESVKRILEFSSEFNLVIEPIYVWTEQNLADGPSRDSPLDNQSRFAFSFSVPSELEPYLEHA